jgi:hypothetical protein
MAQLAGFTLETRYADWAGSEFTADSRSWLVLQLANSREPISQMSVNRQRADGLQIEAGPAGCVGCVERMGHVTVARSIMSLVHMSLMLSIPYPEFSWTEFSKAV